MPSPRLSWKNLFGSDLFQKLLLAALVLFAFWDSLWGGAPRADQLIYLHKLSAYSGLWDIISNTLSLNRHPGAGDFMLYRPVLYLQLGIFYYFFDYDSFKWQLASILLHMLVVFGVHSVLRQVGNIKPRFAFLLAGLFGCNYIGAELVLWNHISGYITFCALAVYAVFYFVKFLQYKKKSHAYLSLALVTLASFTYELGPILNTVFVVVLIYVKLVSDREMKLKFVVLFVCSTLSYLIINLTNAVYQMWFELSARAISDKYGYIEPISLQALEYMVAQLQFWLSGWVLPYAYEILAQDRATFVGYTLADYGFFVNLSAAAVLFSQILSRVDWRNVRKFDEHKRYWLSSVVVVGILCAYSYMIAFGRSMPRGLELVLHFNVYYAYVACFIVITGYAVVRGQSRILSVSESELASAHYLKQNSNLLIFSALSILLTLNLFSTRELAAGYRYQYSPNKLEVVQEIDNWVEKTNPESLRYFAVHDSCVGDGKIPWFDGQYIRKDINWWEPLFLTDILFPDHSGRLHPQQVGARVDTIYCLDNTVQASSVHENLGPEGLLSAGNPGWHAAVPVQFPQQLGVEFKSARLIRNISMLSQTGEPSRAPKKLTIEFKQDNSTWKEAFNGELDCGAYRDETWQKLERFDEFEAKHLRITMHSNCGHPQLLTLKGLSFD